MKKDYIIISNWSINTIAKLISSFVTIDMIRGDFVYKQGEESNAIYFATEGNFDVYIDVNVQSAKALCQYSNKKSIIYAKINLSKLLLNPIIYQLIETNSIIASIYIGKSTKYYPK